MLKKLSFVVFSLIIALVALYKVLEQKTDAIQTTSSSQKSEVIIWRMANTWPKGMPVFEDITYRFAKNVQDMTGGRLIIEIHPSNKHKAPFGVFDMVRNGAYQMAHTGSYYWKGKDAATPLFTTTPWGMTAWESYAWFYFDGGLEMMNNVYAKHGLLSFPGGNTGVQMGGWFKKEINSLEDMQGLKMRIPGLGGDVINEIGAYSINIPGGELYTALELGTIDALEWVSPALDLDRGYQQIAKYYYTGWHEPAAELQFLIHKESFEKLPQDIKSILLIAMREASYHMTVHMQHANAIAWEKMQTKHKDIKIKTFPDDVLKELKKATKVVLDDLAEQSPDAKEVIQSQTEYLHKIRKWTDISEKIYLNSR